MKISYLTNHQNLALHDSTNPLTYISDRRRVVGWAKARGHTIVSGVDKGADAAVFGILSDFRELDKFKSSYKILDMVDGYLALDESPIFDLARGFYRPDRGYRSFRFSRRLQSVCASVDCIVVGSTEQRDLVLPFNKNVHVILDSQIEFGPSQTIRWPNTKTGENRILLWEGLSVTLKHLINFANPIDEFLERTNSTLRVLTNENIPRGGINVFSRDSSSYIRRAFPRAHKNVEFEIWSKEALLAQSLEADFAIIPIDTRDKMGMYKPENKALLLLSIGLPVFVSPIFSYVRVMRELGLGTLVVKENNWGKSLNEWNRNLALARKSQSGRPNVSDYLNSTDLLKAWDNVFKDTL